MSAPTSRPTATAAGALRLLLLDDEQNHRISPLEAIRWVRVFGKATAAALDAYSRVAPAARPMIAEDLGAVEHDGELLLIPSPGDNRHCFDCTSRSVCRDTGRCRLGWHNTHRLRAYASRARAIARDRQERAP